MRCIDTAFVSYKGQKVSNVNVYHQYMKSKYKAYFFIFNKMKDASTQISFLFAIIYQH